MTSVDGLLFDIEGVLTVSWEAIPGAPAALAELRQRGLPVRFATNTTTRTRDRIAEALISAGFEAEPAEILTAPAATAAYLRTHHPDARCYVLSSGDIGDDLEGVNIVTEDPIDVFVMGGAGMVFTHEQLNRALGLLLEGAEFVAMHRNLYWRTSSGMELDTGAYVLGLEAASGRTPVVIGKPSAEFFLAGVGELDLTPDRVAMVGDDIENDVLGAQAAGLHGILVRTGKYRAEAVAAASGRPEHEIDSLADLLDLIDS